MINYQKIKERLVAQSNLWLITGVSGFIGSNLLETLLKLNQNVIGVDNLSTGFFSNLEKVNSTVSHDQWQRFRFLKGDIREVELVKEACKGVDYILHQAAVGSVTRSIEDPSYTNSVNVSGFLNVLIGARDAGVKNFVYASSSSVYGDSLDLPKVESDNGNLLSPYAVTKKFNEHYADVFFKIYGQNSIGLRYFNVYGPRQDPASQYSAVIPKWINALITGAEIGINGDGHTSRDFCYIDNVVQANILAATVQSKDAKNQIYNVAAGKTTSLNSLIKVMFEVYSELTINAPLTSLQFTKYDNKPTIKYGDFRLGDIKDSWADISRSEKFLGYRAFDDLKYGLSKTIESYIF